MARHVRLQLLTLATCSTIAVCAQVTLPYSTGFDNSAQQAGWQQFRTGELSNYDWGVGNSGIAPSAPNILYHDYPVGGTSTDTVGDWFVSPLLDLTDGADLSMRINVYSIVGANTPADQMHVMLLTGSNDPENATSISLLADLTDSVSSSPDFLTVPGIAVPATSGGGYIAFKYRATNNWFTISIDDVNVTASGIGMEEASTTTLPLLHLFPNPTDGRMSLSCVPPTNAMISVHDATGRTVLTAPVVNGAVDVSALDAGRYVLILREGDHIKRGACVKR